MLKLKPYFFIFINLFSAAKVGFFSQSRQLFLLIYYNLLLLCKLHEYLRQTAFLSLRLCKAKIAQHRHSLNFNDTQLS